MVSKYYDCQPSDKLIWKMLVDGAPFNAELDSHTSLLRDDQRKNFSIEGGTLLQSPLKLPQIELCKIQINLSEGR